MIRETILAGAIGAVVATAAAPAGAATSAQPTAGSTLASARKMLATAEQELSDARQTAATIRKQARSGAIDPEVLAALQPADESDFPTGAPDIELIAALIDDAPTDTTLREATIGELATVTPREADQQVPDSPLVVTAPADAVKAAEARIARAEEEKATAQALIKQLEGQDDADGPGSAKLAELCSKAGVVVEVCQPVRWNEAHLKFDTVMIGRTVNIKWDDVKEVGGYRPYDPYPDHPSGRAADIMMPNGGSGSDVQLGNEIARYFQKHAKEYGIYYMLWRQKMWKAGDPVGAWTSVSDRGSPTANHMDHVHITVENGHAGTAWREMVKDAKRSADA